MHSSRSRKASKAHKDLVHIDTVDKHLKTVDAKNKPEVQKHHWFQKAVWMDDKPVYTRDELRDLTIEYLSRNDDEVGMPTTSMTQIITSYTCDALTNRNVSNSRSRKHKWEQSQEQRPSED